MKIETYQRIFENKISCIKLNKKSVQWESCSTQTEGRTDMTNVIVACHNFVNAPKNNIFCVKEKSRELSWYGDALI